MEKSSSSLACLVLDDKTDNPENRDIDQHEENEGKRETSTAVDLEIPNPLEMLDFVNLLLKKLDGKTLKSSLMVSKLWNEEGMKLFIKNHYIRVPPKFSLKTEHEKNEMIEELKKLCSKFTLIPNIIINKSRDIQILKDSKILKEVKYVKISSDYMNRDQYRDNIEKVLEECGNLSFLEIVNFHYTLPTFLSKSVETGKDGSFTISNLWIKSFNTDDCGMMEKFANSRVRVIHLCLEMFSTNPIELERISRALEKILWSNKDCLETLKLNVGRNVLSIKNIPLLLQLKELSIQLQPRSPGPFPALELATIFPPAFKFSINCPNLKTCSFTFFTTSKLDVPFDGENFLDMIFATTGPAPSVKSLTFDSPCETMKLNKLFQTFNGIESLTMGPNATETNLSPVWELGQNLKSLKVALHLYVNRSCQLLAQATGYPLDFTTRIWNSPDDLKNVELPPRAGPSIFDLQDLESFTTTDGWKGYTVFSKWNKLIYELALRHMPKMKKRQEAA